MDLKQLKNNLASTPAFVLDEAQVEDNLASLQSLKKQADCQILYSIKALPLESVIKTTQQYLDGLSVSSLFEARLAKEILGDAGYIHITTPGLRDEEFAEVARLCTHISFNSINQYQRLIKKNIDNCSLGLRVNPKLSFSNDLRFDPCRPYSKLGVELGMIDAMPEKIQGLHFHTVFSSTDYVSLEKTVELLEQKAGQHLAQLKWLNIGGGYLHAQIANHQPLIDLLKRLKAKYELDIYIEPGKAIVGDAGYLVTTVIDTFNSDGKYIAVLDTSISHNPEVFEYQKSPELVEADSAGEYSCLLVGSSCLAGDIFGEYLLTDELKVGDRLVFSNVGAYSLSKANRFNGYNLPDIYSVDKKQNITLLKQNSYQSYREQWAG